MIVTELFAKLGVLPDVAGFKAAEGRIQGLRKHLQHAIHFAEGLFAVHLFEGFIHGITQAGAALADASHRIGITTTSLQELNLAAELTGATSGDLETGLRFLAKNAYEAAQGGKEAKASFASLGLEVKDNNGGVKSADVLFSELAEKIAGVTDSTKRTALAVKLLGRGGAALIPLLSEGAEGIAKARKEARELGGGFDPELVHNTKELEDNLKRLEFSILSIKSRLGNFLIPIVDRAVHAMTGWVVSTHRMMQANVFLQTSLRLITAAVAVWGVVATLAAREAIAHWLAAAAPFLKIAAILILLALAIDDVHALLTGGKSLIGKYLDEWLGIGTADQLVRKWSEGFEILTDTVLNFGKNLMQTAHNALEIVGLLGDALMNLGAGNFDKAAELAGRALDKIKGAVLDVTTTLDAAVTGVVSGDPRSLKDKITSAQVWGLQGSGGGKFDLDPRAAGRGINASPMLDPSTPRAAGRGLGAKLQAGSAGFGQAAPGAVSRLFRPSAVEGAHAVMGGHGEHGAAGPTAQGGHGGNVTVHETNHVEVHAKTNADPKEIARVAVAEIAAHHSKVTRNLRAAHAPNTDHE